jgi:hypothetical protein
VGWSGDSVSLGERGCLNFTASKEMEKRLIGAEKKNCILDDDATTRKELQSELNTGQITSIKLIFMQLPFIYWIVFGLLFRYMGISV